MVGKKDAAVLGAFPGTGPLGEFTLEDDEFGWALPIDISPSVARTFHSNNFNMIEGYVIRGKAKASSSLDLTACECLSS